jgi:hypothetical protein
MVPMVLYIVLSLLVAFVGTGKRGGFLLIFVICLALTPVVGIVVVLMANDGKPNRSRERDIAFNAQDGSSNPNSEGIFARISRLTKWNRKREDDVVLIDLDAGSNRKSEGGL